MVTAPYTFDLSGGRLCLDFANTVSNRGSQAPVDHLQSYDDLLAFMEQARALPPAAVRELSRAAASHAKAARQALDAAIGLREHLYDLFASLAAGRTPRAADLEALNARVPSAFARARLSNGRKGFTLTSEADAADPAAPLVPVVRSAVDLLTSPDLDRVRTCAAGTCAWLFVDTTRNRTRRWCDMKVCGNRAKVRRFRSAR